jgi:hypothetical protein
MTDKKEFHFGYFHAKYLAVLKPIVDYTRETDNLRWFNGCISLEPCPAGGVYIIAYSAHATAVIRDPDGHINTPVTLDIPSAACDAARAPEPVRMSFEGTPYACPLPEWVLPWQVCVHNAGIFINTKMRNPDWSEEHDEFHPVLYSRICSHAVHIAGLDYKLTPGSIGMWRHLLKGTMSGIEPDAANVCFNTRIPHLFTDIVKLFQNDQPRVVHHRRTSGPTLIRVEEAPDFIGFWMPQTYREIEPIAEHFMLPEATHEGSRSAQ